MSTWLDCGSEDDLIADEKAYRDYMARIQSHPDCSDPDHPGCEACDGGDE